MNAPRKTQTPNEIRKRGLKLLVGGVAVFGAILFLMYWLSAYGHSFHFALIPAAFPFVFICVGFIEAASGVPYLQLAQRWMELHGWQRGLLGTFIVVAAFAIIICVVTFFVLLFT